MTQSRDGTRSLLRWYPRAWRERYGDELVALVEDSSGGRAPTPKIKVSIVWAGLREHAHDAGFVGTRRSAPEQLRTGALVVLCAWAGFVLAGASFSKLSEHFAQSVPATSRALPQVAFSVVVVLGAVGATLVLIGGLVALPAFVRFVRSGGWLSLSRHVIRATGLSVIAVCAVIPLSFWAHHLNEIQRNGGDRIYSGAFVTWGLLVAATLTQWTMVGVAAARRIDFARKVLRFEAVLAVLLAGVMAAVTIATALWWAAMATDAPWFIQGTPTGTRPSPVNLQLLLTMALMLSGVLIAGFGVIRIRRSWTGLQGT